MKQFILIFGIILFTSLSVFSQKDEILLTIDNKEITKDEFIHIYTKNNSPDISSEIKTVDEYLELFINFKLKVLAAEEQGIDTTKSFLSELEKYTKQLAAPYFKDTEKEEQLYAEAIERSQIEARVNYIFLQLPQNSTPKDTLEIYNKVLDIKKRILDGEDFSKVAVETSNARNVKRDKGDAWFVAALSSPYAIENFIFDSEINKISDPISVPGGYFLIKVPERRKAIGEVKVAHILISLPKGSSEEDSLKASEKLNTVLQEIEAGKDFAELAKKYSDDKGSAKKGGELSWFGTGKMVRKFETAAFSLKNNGDIADPIRTIFGWHIIKRLDKKEIIANDEYKEKIKEKVKKTKRFELIYSSAINKIKKEYNYKENNTLDNFYKNVDVSIFKGAWEAKELGTSEVILFSFADKKYTEKDFANFLVVNQKTAKQTDINSFVDKKYSEFVEQELKKYELTKLAEKNKDFFYITNEYHDGLLLFDVTEKMVWNKAVSDTIGLKKYYNKNKNNYYQKLNIAVYSYTNDKILKKAKKVLKKKEKKGYSDSMVVTLVDETGENFKLVHSGIFKKEDNTAATFLSNKYEKNEINNKQNIVVNLENKEIIYIKNNFYQVKGLVTADYQNVLEKEWIDSLRKTHNITINNEVLEKVKKEVKN